jgi:hypothetical protein
LYALHFRANLLREFEQRLAQFAQLRGRKIEET